METFERGDEVWDLLGQSRPVAERPFFASKVLRAAAALDGRSAPGWFLRGLRVRLPALAFGVLTLVALFSLGQSPTHSDLMPYYGAEAAALEIEAVTNMDELLGMSDFAGWEELGD